MASRSRRATPASRQARSMVGTMASRWARLATSGTTPPKRACSSTLLATVSTSSVRPWTMPTPVSSQEVSMPSTSGSSAMYLLPEQEAHDEGVDVSGLVVAAAHRDDLEAGAVVEAAGGVVVGAHLEQHGLDAVGAGAAHQLVQQQAADAAAPVGGRRGDGHDICGVAG